MIVIGVLLLAGATTLVFQHWACTSPESVRAENHIQEIAGRGTVHQPAVRARATDSRLSKALDKLDGAGEVDLQVTLQKIASCWPENELRQAVVGLYDKPGDDSTTGLLRSSLLERWARLDPRSAALWTNTLPECSDRLDAVTKVALVWNETNPSDAWDWALSLAPESTRQSALLALGYEVTREAPALALDRLSVLENSPDRLRFIEHVISNLAATDPEGALNRASQLHNPDERNHALVALAISWSESDPVAAATLAVDAIAAGPDQDRAVVAVIQRWSQKDPDAARAWVGRFPDGSLKQDALDQIEQQTALSQELKQRPITD